ncbi:MAG: hypothetical protein ACREL9_13040 [Gemmatimonadales bacterium]
MAAAAPAQNLWTRQIGIQGGFARTKEAGTGQSDHTDVFGIPTLSAGALLPTGAALFAIIPVSPKIAVEPSFAHAQLTDATGIGAALEAVSVGLRLDYALSSRFYAALGPSYTLTSSLGSGTLKQFGLQAAAGYRLTLSSALSGRLEAKWTTWGKTDDLPPTNVYAVEFGLSTPLGGAARRAPARAPAGRAWRPELGLRGGYSRVHLVSEGDAALLALPGFTNLLAAAGLAAPTSVFATFPVGQRWAVEPGLELLRAQSGGITQTGAHVSARLNYSVNDHWYAAAGGNLLYRRNTGADAATTTGANLAWGYRFPMMGALGGRVELSYIAIGANADYTALTGNGASNTFSVTFGLTMPLK